MSMKRFLYSALLLLCLSSCSEDLSEYFTRADEQEARNKEQEARNKELEERNRKLREEALRLQARLDSLANAYNNSPTRSGLVAMAFAAAENPILSEDLHCEVSEYEGLVECWIPKLVDSKELTPRFSFRGSEVKINGESVTSGSKKFDFTAPVTLTVVSSNKTHTYTVYVHAYTGLPVMRINTAGGAAIESKEEYVSAHMTLTEDVLTRGPGDVIEADLQIKGRGNSSWVQPKKPYRLKFNEKVALLGEHKDKSWVLIANYTDKSMIRNHLAFALGKMSKLDWTPNSHFVELYLNGQYNGTYLLCEKINISNHRVAVGDDGFIFEVTGKATEEENPYFTTGAIDYPIQIKAPTVEWGSADFIYAGNFVSDCENAIFAGSSDLWSTYLDLDSFVDWYLIHEISKNEDSMFHVSCFMNMKRGGKLKMGPIWDFDIAFGNVKEESNTTAMLPEGTELDWSQWYTRLMYDRTFVKKLKERYAYFYSHKNEIMSFINQDAHYLRYAAQENERKWGTLYHYTYKQYDIWGSYQNEAQSLKDWLDRRMEWLKNYIDQL